MLAFNSPTEIPSRMFSIIYMFIKMTMNMPCILPLTDTPDDKKYFAKSAKRTVGSSENHDNKLAFISSLQSFHLNSLTFIILYLIILRTLVLKGISHLYPEVIQLQFYLHFQVWKPPGSLPKELRRRRFQRELLLSLQFPVP